MHTPQIIYIVLAAIGLGIEIERHGQPKTGTHNWVTQALISGLVIGLLYWGGFFN